SDQERKLDLLRDLRHRLRHLPERNAVIAHDLPHVNALTMELDEVAALLPPAADAPGLLAELRSSLTALRGQLGEGRAEVLRDFEQRMAGDLAADLPRLRDVSTPEPLTLDDLPPAFRERYVGRTGQWLVQVFGKDCLWDFEPLAHFVRRIQAVDPEATG